MAFFFVLCFQRDESIMADGNGSKCHSRTAERSHFNSKDTAARYNGEWGKVTNYPSLCPVAYLFQQGGQKSIVCQTIPLTVQVHEFMGDISHSHHHSPMSCFIKSLGILSHNRKKNLIYFLSSFLLFNSLISWHYFPRKTPRHNSHIFKALLLLWIIVRHPICQFDYFQTHPLVCGLQ